MTALKVVYYYVEFAIYKSTVNIWVLSKKFEHSCFAFPQVVLNCMDRFNRNKNVSILLKLCLYLDNSINR